MDDDKILARGGDEHDIKAYAEQTNGHYLTEEDFTKLPPIVTTVYDHATVVVQDHVKKLTIIRGDTEVTITLKPHAKRLRH